ncbi:hypothetical protein [Streptomyces longispororuber]|uniref:hypothetical protein n=1 Tax=Streptomyces longispororuber TaxID=68230 RepID=UPI0036F5E7C9
MQLNRSRRPRASGSRGRRALATGVFALAAAALAAGCGDPGDLRSAGATPTAVGPTRLWPDLPPASSPVGDYGNADTEEVDGVEVPGGDLRKVDPVDIVKAQAAAHPDDYTGPSALYKETAEALRDCGRKGKECPVLKAYYRDFTGDGKDDVVVGIRMPEEQLAIRVYAMEKGHLTQIMGTSDAVLGVELAGRDLVLRAVSDIPGYEYRTAWSWDRHQRAMLPTRDEFLRSSDAPRPEGARSPVPAPVPELTEDPGRENPAPGPSAGQRPSPDGPDDTSGPGGSGGSGGSGGPGGSGRSGDSPGAGS